jgi:hypothetical protein
LHHKSQFQLAISLEISMVHWLIGCLLFSVGKLMELHGEGSAVTKGGETETGEKVARPDGYEPPVQQSV